MADHFSTAVSGIQSSGVDRPARHWTVDLGPLVRGRLAKGKRGGFKARPQLGKQLIEAIRHTASTKKLSGGSVRLCLDQVTRLFRFLDRLEENNKNIKIDDVSDISGATWAAFTKWLSLEGPKSTRSMTYWQCKRLLIQAITIKTGIAPPDYTFPPNPFSKAGLTLNWNNSNELTESEIIQISKVLKEQITNINTRLLENQKLIPDFSDMQKPDFPSPAYQRRSSNSRPVHRTSRDSSIPKSELVNLVLRALHERGELLRSAVIIDNRLKLINKYPECLTFADIGVTPIRNDGVLTKVGIYQRTLILESVSRGPQRLSVNTATSLGFSYYQLRALTTSLQKDGSLAIVKHSARMKRPPK